MVQFCAEIELDYREKMERKTELIVFIEMSLFHTQKLNVSKIKTTFIFAHKVKDIINF